MGSVVAKIIAFRLRNFEQYISLKVVLLTFSVCNLQFMRQKLVRKCCIPAVEPRIHEHVLYSLQKQCCNFIHYNLRM